MTSALSIRPGEAADTDAVLEIWRRSEASATVTDTPADVLRLLRDHPGTLLVAVPEGAVIGTVIAAWDGWRGTIYRLAVLQEHRRRGIARALVEEAVRRLGAAGAKRITALVEGDHPWALAFWDAAGFHRHSGMLRYFKNLP